MIHTLFTTQPGMETPEFKAFSQRHDHRIMIIVLGVYLALDIVLYFHLGMEPGGYLSDSWNWVIPAGLFAGLLVELWLLFQKEGAEVPQEVGFILYILGSRVVLGNLIGFQMTIMAVYVGMMLFLSALFYFRNAFTAVVLFLQALLHGEALLGLLGQDAFIVLLVTDVFMITSMLMCWERHRSRLQGYILNRSILDKNGQLQEAHDAIKEYSHQTEEQLKRTRQAESLMKGLLENAETALVLVNSEGRLKYFNDAIEDIFGVPFKEMNDANLLKILGKEGDRCLKEAMFDARRLKKSTVLPAMSGQHRDGNTRTVRIKLDPLDIEEERYIMIGITDITQEVKRQEQLQQLSRMKDVVLAINHRLSEDNDLESYLNYVLSRVREVIPHADLGCVLLLEDESTLYMASSFGYQQEDSRDFRLHLNESFAYRITGGDFSRTVIINDIQQLVRPEYVEILDNEDHYTVQSSISGPILKEGRLCGFINIDSKDNNVYTEDDFTIMEYLREQLGLALSRHEMYQEYMYLSKHDQLTGFLNRWYLKEIEISHVQRWKRHGEQVLIAAMDINDLKRINDRLGHHEGDAYIQLFSTTMQRLFRTTDILIRMGGDEFMGIFFRMEEHELKEKLDEVNRFLCSSELQMKVPDLALGFGYGIAVFGEAEGTLQELLQTADSRMYLHKAAMKGEALKSH